MNKILVGLILGIVICIGIIFDFFDMFMSIALIIGMYELINNYFKLEKRKEEILISFGLLILIITGEMISSKILKVRELIFVLLLVIMSDVFQEFSGKYFGKNKIGWISPNKTYEGYIGGYIGILIIYFINTYRKSAYNFFEFNLIYIFGIFGDLFFSYIKRKIEVKDYSEILLSHGGVLDRLDSFILAILGFGLYKTIK
jgi:phosphatidate cytidylyltransferase